jgi:hypothetical protein
MNLFLEALCLLYALSFTKLWQIKVYSSSSSSSTGTTAHCGLWPVEQDPSIFSYLSPTLSIIVKSIQLFPLFDFRNSEFNLKFINIVSSMPIATVTHAGCIRKTNLLTLLVK